MNRSLANRTAFSKRTFNVINAIALEERRRKAAATRIQTLARRLKAKSVVALKKRVMYQLKARAARQRRANALSRKREPLLHMSARGLARFLSRRASAQNNLSSIGRNALELKRRKTIAHIGLNSTAYKELQKVRMLARIAALKAPKKKTSFNKAKALLTAPMKHRPRLDLPASSRYFESR